MAMAQAYPGSFGEDALQVGASELSISLGMSQNQSKSLKNP